MCMWTESRACSMFALIRFHTILPSGVLHLKNLKATDAILPIIVPTVIVW